MQVIDLRSDTVTHPCAAMRQAMAEAEVGDDVYGEDPTINELELYAAELVGMEAGLFVTSGTQGNLVALLTHCARGDGAILGMLSHTYLYEAGGLAVLGGIMPLLVDDSGGLPTPEAVLHVCHPHNVHYAPARLLCLENTHNRTGGLAIPVEVFAQTVQAARQAGLNLHLDGARLFNATAKWQVEPAIYTACVDSVQFCLSKALGAPVGSMLCGTAEFIHVARHWRKRLGGGLRQGGVLAAAGLFALRENRLRLVEDHAHAELLARLLREEGLAVEESPWCTNMVFVNLPPEGMSAKEVTATCAEQGVLFGDMGERRIRLVTHLDVGADEVRTAARELLRALQANGR